MSRINSIFVSKGWGYIILNMEKLLLPRYDVLNVAHLVTAQVTADRGTIQNTILLK